MFGVNLQHHRYYFISSSSTHVYLIDTPGHADFTADAAAALRLADGAALVVDAAEGCTAHTNALLRQAPPD